MKMKQETALMLLAIMRRHCRECRKEGQHRLHTLNAQDCATCCIPGVIAAGIMQTGSMPDEEEIDFLADIEKRQKELGIVGK